MPSNLTADDKQAVVEHLRQEYFLVRTQTVLLAVALLAAFGVGTVATAYTAAKSVAVTEAEKVAKAAVNDTAAKVATDEIIKLKTIAEQEKGEIVKLRADAKQELEQIRSKREEATKTASGLTPEVDRIKSELAKTSRFAYDSFDPVVSVGIPGGVQATPGGTEHTFADRPFGTRVVAAWYNITSNGGNSPIFAAIVPEPSGNFVKLRVKSDPAKGNGNMQIRVHVLYEK